MPTNVKRLAFVSHLGIGLFSVAVLLCVLPRASSSSERRDELDRWVPSVQLLAGLVAQNADAYLETGPVLQPFDTGVNPPVRQPIEPDSPGHGADRMMMPFVGGGLEIMTPRLVESFWSPRLFAHADAAFQFGPARDMVKLGSPGEMAPPPGVPFPFEHIFVGQGSTSNVGPESLLVFAGGGVAFTFNPYDRRLRLKTSVEYIREEITLTGLVNRVVTVQAGLAGDTGMRFIELRASETKVFHGVGPGIELELDTRRAGPFMLSVFVNTSAYAMLGDREIRISANNEDPAGNPDETAEWWMRKNSWSIRGALGLRFRWVPE